MKKMFLICACFLSACFYVIIDAEAKHIPSGDSYEVVARCEGANQKDEKITGKYVTQYDAEKAAKHKAWVGRYWGTDCKNPKIRSIKMNGKPVVELSKKKEEPQHFIKKKR